MSLKNTQVLLRGYRPAGPNEAAIEKAAKSAEADAAVQAKLQEQRTFDEQLIRAIAALTPPSDLRERLDAAAKQGGRRPAFILPAILAAGFGFLIIIGLVVAFALDRQSKFPGREAVVQMVAGANEVDVMALQEVHNPTGELGDWFVMRGYDNYTAPAEFSKAPAVGSRVFRYNNRSVAQVAVNVNQDLVYLYTFRPEDLGVDLAAEKDWRYLELDQWAGAIRREGGNCVVVSKRGDPGELREILAQLKPQQP